MRIFVVALIAVSLVVHIVFLVWCHLFLRQWSRDLDKRQRQREERERILDEQDRRWKKDMDQQQRYLDEQERETEREIQALRDATKRLARAPGPWPGLNRG